MESPDTNNVEQTICRLVSEELKIPAAQLHAGTNLRELPGVESIRVLRIISKLERAYDIEFEDDLVFRVRTVDELAQAIRQRLGMAA